MQMVNIDPPEFRQRSDAGPGRMVPWCPKARRAENPPMRILVIEDNRNLVANLFDYFEARGHVLDAAPDGLTGLRLAVTQSFDVIVLDWMLPRMDGLAVLGRVRAADVDTPVLMLTARDELPDKITGFRSGADDYLTCPNWKSGWKRWSPGQAAGPTPGCCRWPTSSWTCPPWKQVAVAVRCISIRPAESSWRC